MPASKPDLESPHGRLQYARIQAGYEQDEFSKLMDYESASGWAKVETGQIDLKYDHLLRANTILQLDIRFYFGEISYEEAKAKKAKTIEDLADRFERLEKHYSPRDHLDEIAESVMARAELYEFVQFIRFWDGAMIRRFKEWAAAYFQGRQDEKEIRLQNGDKKEKAS